MKNEASWFLVFKTQESFVPLWPVICRPTKFVDYFVRANTY